MPQEESQLDFRAYSKILQYESQIIQSNQELQLATEERSAQPHPTSIRSNTDGSHVKSIFGTQNSGTAELLMKSWEQSTIKVYNSSYTRFLNFCTLNCLDPSYYLSSFHGLSYTSV
ncbi:hypothetical protein ACTFIZ_002949 [Dictyostelium cf. discoideum]